MKNANLDGGNVIDNISLYRSTEFGELSAQEITEYISDSKLKVKTEDPVFEAVCMWVRVDPVNR